MAFPKKREREKKTYAETLKRRKDQLADTMRRKAAGEELFLFVRTGLRDWDANGGVERGSLTAIGAATGDGKSFIKLKLATQAASDGLRVLMIDMEDLGAKTADRTFSNETGLNNLRMSVLELDPFDLECIERAYEKAKQWAEKITHYEGGMTTTEVLELMMSEPWDLILVDYAQAFPEDDDKNMERTIADFAWAANEHAKESNAAVVVFSQLNREVEKRGYDQLARSKWKDPDRIDVEGFCPTGRSDIAWAKELGEKAKCIMYLFRPGRMAKKLGAKSVKDNRIKVVVAKRNFGIEEDMIFAFDGATATISDLEKKAA